MQAGEERSMTHVEVRPDLLRWARARAGFNAAAPAQRFPKLEAWERRQSQPTLKRLEAFARATCTPVGFLFLQKPPVEKVPIPDFRTRENVHVGHPSPNLLDTVYICQQRHTMVTTAIEQAALKQLAANWRALIDQRLALDEGTLFDMGRKNST